MAQSVDSLYISLGLNLSELETDFIAADRTVNENIRRLSRQSEIIRLRTEVEIAGLDETADAERILQTRMDSLNQRMAIQRDRVRLLTAELRSLTAAHGEESAIVQRATMRLERERLALSNLEQELQGLTDAQGESNGALGELGDMLPAVAARLNPVIAGITALATSMVAAVTATQDLLAEFRELQNQSYELNMSFPDTRNFLREMKLAGGDIGDFEGYIRGISDAYVKGEYDDPEFIALRKYGAEIVDETGRLKNFADMTDEVYRAWEKANAAGEGIEFLQLTGGEAGVRDAIQYFTRLKEAREDAAQIFKAKIDDKGLHEIDRTFGKLDAQAQEMKASLGGIFAPAVQSAAEKFFDIIHDGTQYLEENKDAIQRWGFIIAELFSELAPKVDKLPLSVFGQFKTAFENLSPLLKPVFEAFGNETLNSDILAGKLFDDFADDNFITQAFDRAEQKYKNFKAAAEEAKKADAALGNNDPLNQYDWKRANAFRDEAEDIRLELAFGDNDYRKSLAELELWRKRERGNKNFLSSDEGAAIQDLYAAKLAQIEKEHSDKLAESIQEHWQNFADIEYGLTHTAFEKQLRDIDLWKDALHEKAETSEEVASIIAESAAKEAQAFEDEVDRIQGLTQSLEDEIFEMENSKYEADKRRAYQKAQKALDEGVDAATVQRYLSGKIGEFDQKARESREKDGDYTKKPTVALPVDNIKVIDRYNQYADENTRRANIGVMVDESRIRAQLSPLLSDEARYLVEAVQSTRDFADVQRQFAGGFQMIEGDQFIAPPTAELQQFGVALQQATAGIEDAAPVQKIAQAESALADNVKGASNIIADFSNDLIDAHGKLKDALNTLPPAQEDAQPPTDGLIRLSASTRNLPQDLLARQMRDVSDIPPQQQIMPTAEQPDERLTPYITTDLSSLAAPLSAIDQKLDSLMQSLQRDTTDNSFAGFGDALAEKLGALPNIESYARDIVTAVQSIDFPTEVIVTPLSNISGVIQQILTQLQNRQLPPITIAPNIDIDLGGAYVFDDTLKKALVDDITTDVVVHVKDAVQQATSKSSYGYSA